MLESRLATAADAITLSELAAEVFRDAYRSAFDSDQQVEDFIATNFTPSVMSAELEAGHAWYSIGLVNGIAAGFIKMERTAAPACVGCLPSIELAKLYVLRPFHGCGIANVLMERGLEHASLSGASQVWLCVWERNARAAAFYRRWGFTSVGEMSFLWSGVAFRDFVMTRRNSEAVPSRCPMTQSSKSSGVRLRNVEQDDLPRMYEMQLDSESNRLAVTIPRSEEAFSAHWENALRDPRITAKVIVVGEVLAGYVSCFQSDGLDSVGYWIDKDFWGQGIATRALELLLDEVANRPLHARVATSNAASLRVLQKCGFEIVRVQVSPADDRYPECEETILVLR